MKSLIVAFVLLACLAQAACVYAEDVESKTIHVEMTAQEMVGQTGELIAEVEDVTETYNGKSIKPFDSAPINDIGKYKLSRFYLENANVSFVYYTDGGFETKPDGTLVEISICHHFKGTLAEIKGMGNGDSPRLYMGTLVNHDGGWRKCVNLGYFVVEFVAQ